MNTRIRDVIRRADFIDTELLSEPQTVMLEKFAELIVRECISQCWTVSELEHKGDVVYQCSKRIRKHFGVDE